MTFIMAICPDVFAYRKPLSNISSVKSFLSSLGPRFIKIHKCTNNAKVERKISKQFGLTGMKNERWGGNMLDIFKLHYQVMWKH